ncbi:hypothetical protein ACFY2H_06220 [Streptomyces griseofuscus]|nr:hypothetical protein [Streptomyces murinus]MBA9050192.1 hypothetical protein [Streptomyces murinus]
MSTPFFTPDRQTAAASRITESARLQGIDPDDHAAPHHPSQQ